MGDLLGTSEMSRYPQHVLNQGYIEKEMLKGIREHAGLEVERGVLPVALEIDESKAEDPAAYPLTITLQHLGEEETQPFQISTHSKVKHGDGVFRSNLAIDDTDDLIEKIKKRESRSEIVHAKYLLGCEGAHSWIRRRLGLKMEGESTDYIWGVLDIIPITDFPDIRKPGTLQTSHGSMLIVPREKKLVRLYIQLMEVSPEDGHVDRTKITPAQILEAARKIFHPYSMDYTFCDWWTAYQIGQRVGDSFSDETNHIFLAGDAVHTHSPKAGQGMNVSMQDTFNLAWKLAGVINGQLARSVLPTYQAERKSIARELIDFDHELSRKFSGKPSKQELFDLYAKNKLFISGTAHEYSPSSLIAAPDSAETNGHSESPVHVNPIPAKQHLAPQIHLGARIHGGQVIRHADARPYDLQHWLRSDGRWRLIVFPGDIDSAPQMNALNALGDNLSAPDGILARYKYHAVSTPAMTSASHDLKGVKRDVCWIEVLTVHAGDRHKVDITSFHKAFVPWDKEEGFDYGTVFVDGESTYDGSSGKVYEFYGISKESGCMVLVRPDHHVSWIGEIGDADDLAKFLEGAGLQSVL